MFRYARRLDRDLQSWQASGWVSADGAASIRKDLATRSSVFALGPILAILAAVLIGFAAMSFVAANWQDMSKLTRLSAIFGGMWGLFGLAHVLFARSKDVFGHAALLAAVSLFGAGIMLIAQMYHMDGHPPDAVLLWGIGALATGLLMRSNPVLGAALVLFCTWSIMEFFDRAGSWWRGGGQSYVRVHFAFLLAWAGVAAGIAWTRWRNGLYLLAIALSGWIIFSGYLVGTGNTLAGHGVVTLAGLGLVAASVLAGDRIDQWRRISGTLLAYGMVIAFAGALALQFGVDRGGRYTVITGGLTLAAIIAALVWAWRTENRSALWIAYAAFTIEIFALYLQKIGSLLGTSAFFLITGLLVAALAFAAYRLHDSVPNKIGAAS